MAIIVQCSQCGRDLKIPSVMFGLGSLDPAKLASLRAKGKRPPTLHSPFYAPAPKPTLRAGVRALTEAALNLLKK